MVVDVLAVCMGGDKKGVIALCPTHGRFIAHAIGLLGRDLPGPKGLPDLIAEHIGVPALLPSCGGLVLGLAQKELRIGGLMVAGVGGNELPAPGLFRVLPVVEAVFQRLRHALALADVVGNQSCCGRTHAPLQNGAPLRGKVSRSISR